MPDSNIGLGDFPAWIALAISIGGAFRQWIVNRKAQEARSAFEEKTARERIDLQKKLRIEQLAKDIEELCALSLDYWMKSGADTASSGLIINIKTKDISSRIWAYRNFLWGDIGIDFSRLKRQITGGAFQSLSRSASTHNSETVRSFLDSFTEFREKLRIEYDKIDIS